MPAHESPLEDLFLSVIKKKKKGGGKTGSKISLHANSINPISRPTRLNFVPLDPIRSTVYLSIYLSIVSTTCSCRFFLLVCSRFQPTRQRYRRTPTVNNTTTSVPVSRACYWKMSHLVEEFTVRLTSPSISRGMNPSYWYSFLNIIRILFDFGPPPMCVSTGGEPSPISTYPRSITKRPTRSSLADTGCPTINTSTG